VYNGSRVEHVECFTCYRRNPQWCVISGYWIGRKMPLSRQTVRQCCKCSL